VVHRPRLLTDNKSSDVANELADWPGRRGAPRHPQTQDKIERWHQTLKNRNLLEHAYVPGAMEARVSTFVEHYNHARGRESLSDLTPADVYLGHGEAILREWARIKRQALIDHRLRHHAQAALPPNPWGQEECSRGSLLACLDVAHVDPGTVPDQALQVLGTGASIDDSFPGRGKDIRVIRSLPSSPDRRGRL
jgi:Integrase core domain